MGEYLVGEILPVVHLSCEYVEVTGLLLELELDFSENLVDSAQGQLLGGYDHFVGVDVLLCDCLLQTHELQLFGQLLQF